MKTIITITLTTLLIGTGIHQRTTLADDHNDPATGKITDANAKDDLNYTQERYQRLSDEPYRQQIPPKVVPNFVGQGRTMHPPVVQAEDDPAEPEIAAAHVAKKPEQLTGELSVDEIALLSNRGPWLTGNGLSENSRQLINAISNAHLHGLNPEAYSLSTILKYADTLKFSAPDSSERPVLSEKDAALEALAPSIKRRTPDYQHHQFEQILNREFSRLAKHLGQGTVDARAIQTRLYRDVPQVNTDKLLESVKVGKLSVSKALDSVVQTNPEYTRLVEHMRDLHTERFTGLLRTPVDPNGQLTNTDHESDMLAIKHRLIETGDLPYDIEFSSSYDAQLVAALESFQARHGLSVSGNIDLKTRTALNQSLEQEIEAVALSLERWRWMPRDMGDKHLFVNIPNYHVEYRENHDIKLSMVTVVGSKRHQTPAFSKDMTYMEFNPTWTVPASITNSELIPKERRRPGYLASRNFEYLKRVGNKLVTVPADQITEADFRRSSFPYILRQKGGPNNALGRMKFMMPNPYAIYLHDTQAKNLFALNERAFSHGCIRLSEPDKMAKFLMNEDGYEQSKIDSALVSKTRDRVRFRSPIPTHLTYMTTWVDQENKLQQRHDIYGHDFKLKNALIKANTLLSTLEPVSSDSEKELLLASDESQT